MKEIFFATGNVSKGKRFEEGLLKNNIKTLTLDVTNEDKEKVKVNEDHVVDFIVNVLK